MRRLNKHILILFIIVLVSCTSSNEESKIINSQHKSDTLLYLNHSDSAKYVGINTCKQCHSDIYESFIKTGMGKSFDKATKHKSSGDFHKSVIYDKIGDYYYKAFWLNDSLQILEYRLKGKDTIFKRQETVNYIVGSGQHTNSHIQSVNGYLNQMPLTYYTQSKQWDLPPGFENGRNTRFTRKIELECMSCHNNYPDFVLGSENKFIAVPEGINCERCHGPGSIHVAQRQTNAPIDTSKYIDYSIVNPAKLSIDAQFDICQRCHLQGNTVLKQGKSFYDYKPGMKLSDYMTVFLPKYKNADDEFIMASHADRLKQSACFIKSMEKATSSPASKGEVSNSKNKLKPYRDAMTCVTCHNPHVSVRETNSNVFNDACNNCHTTSGKSQLSCSKKDITKTSNCVGCHMPKSGSIDIPHVTVHDHYIRKPITKKDKEGIKEFIGLYAINEKAPSNYIKAKAYINQYEKFEGKAYCLDSALNYLKDKSPEDIKQNFHLLVQLYFNKNNFQKITDYVYKLTDTYLINNLLINQSYSNDDAWACYRVGEAYNTFNNTQKAILYYRQAVKLAPFALDFRNKLAISLINNGLIPEAEKEFEFILKENPKYVSALTNYGFIKINQGKVLEAENLYFKALKIDPDYEQLLLNIAAIYAYKKDIKTSKQYIERILKKNPKHIQAQQALKQLQSMK